MIPYKNARTATDDDALLRTTAALTDSCANGCGSVAINIGCPLWRPAAADTQTVKDDAAPCLDLWDILVPCHYRLHKALPAIQLDLIQAMAVQVFCQCLKARQLQLWILTVPRHGVLCELYCAVRPVLCLS